MFTLPTMKMQSDTPLNKWFIKSLNEWLLYKKTNQSQNNLERLINNLAIDVGKKDEFKKKNRLLISYTELSCLIQLNEINKQCLNILHSLKFDWTSKEPECLKHFKQINSLVKSHNVEVHKIISSNSREELSSEVFKLFYRTHSNNWLELISCDNIVPSQKSHQGRPDFLWKGHLNNRLPNLQQDYASFQNLFKTSAIELKTNFTSVDLQLRGTVILNMLNWLNENGCLDIRDLNNFKNENYVLIKNLKKNEWTAGYNVRLMFNFAGIPPHLYSRELQFYDQFLDTLFSNSKHYTYTSDEIITIKKKLFSIIRKFLIEGAEQGFQNFNFQENNFNNNNFSESLYGVFKNGKKASAVHIPNAVTINCIGWPELYDDVLGLNNNNTIDQNDFKKRLIEDEDTSD